MNDELTKMSTERDVLFTLKAKLEVPKFREEKHLKKNKVDT